MRRPREAPTRNKNLLRRAGNGDRGGGGPRALQHGLGDEAPLPQNCLLLQEGGGGGARHLRPQEAHVPVARSLLHRRRQDPTGGLRTAVHQVQRRRSPDRRGPVPHGARRVAGYGGWWWIFTAQAACVRQASWARTVLLSFGLSSGKVPKYYIYFSTLFFFFVFLY